MYSYLSFYNFNQRLSNNKKQYFFNIGLRAFVSHSTLKSAKTNYVAISIYFYYTSIEK